MKVLKVKAQGLLQAGDTPILIYKLEDGTLTVAQPAIIRYLTGGATTANRHQLKLSKLGHYLSKKMLDRTELAIETGVKLIRLFTAEEWLELCSGILKAEADGKLGKKWTSAPGKVQVLLLLFAKHGISKTMEKAIKVKPVTPDSSFEQHIIRLLDYRC
ncbi:hypothetical protein [Pedobacter sp.]